MSFTSPGAAVGHNGSSPLRTDGAALNPIGIAAQLAYQTHINQAKVTAEPEVAEALYREAAQAWRVLVTAQRVFPS